MRLKLLYESEEIDFGIVDDDKNITEKDVDKILHDLRNPKHLPIIKIVPKLAYYYSVDVIKGRWPEGEEAIKKDPKWAYLYSLYVIKGRWPDGEEAIKKDSGWAYLYSLNIVKGRWPEAEEAIKKDPYWAYNYSRNVVKGRWPDGEEAIKNCQFFNNYLTESLDNNDLLKTNMINKWVHTKQTFILQWEATNSINSNKKCIRGKSITPTPVSKNTIAFVCNIAKTRDLWTITCYFPTAFNGKGAIGQQTALDIDELIESRSI
jgi:hypothetical protein